MNTFVIGQAVVAKDGHVFVLATENHATSKGLDKKGQYWFMGVARASRQRNAFSYYALVIPSFERPEDWPQPPSSAMHLIQLEGIQQGDHDCCDMVQTFDRKCKLLKGLVAADAKWRSPMAVQSALWRAQPLGGHEQPTRAGKPSQPPLQPNKKPPKKKPIPEDLHQWGYQKLLNADTPQLDRVCAQFAQASTTCIEA